MNEVDTELESVKPERSETATRADDREVSPNFITAIIDEDLAANRHRRVVTRFPPEPNGYLHIGHAKSIALQFGLASDYGGSTNLRFDDTNPANEDMIFVEAAERDIRWLGYQWERLLFASDFYERFYQFALQLIREGKAYVDSLSETQIREYRGTVTEPGRESPYRQRSVEENLELFRRMRAGEFRPGEHVLRAKIDMAAPNMKMRDPLLYRIVDEAHYRTGHDWPIYPMYDFAHPLSDAIEGVTHSLCTLEFESNREIYDWLVDALFEGERPHQYEFGRHNIEFTVTRKRRLVDLVENGHVDGWDDPRMPTLAALRRRGVTPEAIRAFSAGLGVTKSDSSVSITRLEHAIRDDLNYKAPRVLAVIDPLKVTLTNYPERTSETITAPSWPADVPREGERALPFSRDLWIERDDFSEAPSKGWRRLSPGVRVRLRHAYVIRCDEVVRDEAGEVVELRCTVEQDSLGEDRPVQGTIHWLSAPQALPAEFRLYDRLFTVPDPDDQDRPFTDFINPEALVVRHGFIEPSVANDPEATRYQFERQGYFVRDALDSAPGALVFNRTVALKDTWAAKGKSKGTNASRSGPMKEIRRATRANQPSDDYDPLEGFTAEQRDIYQRYTGALELGENEAAVLAGEASLGAFFEEAVRAHDAPRAIANWLVNELLRFLKGRDVDELPFGPTELAGLVGLIEGGTINGRIGKEVLEVMVEQGGDPGSIVEARGLRQLTDEDALDAVVERVLDANPDKVDAYRNGKTGLIGFFVGQVMRETHGRANPQVVKDLVKSKLVAAE